VQRSLLPSRFNPPFWTRESTGLFFPSDHHPRLSSFYIECYKTSTFGAAMQNHFFASTPLRKITSLDRAARLFIPTRPEKLRAISRKSALLACNGGLQSILWEYSWNIPHWEYF
jgi:hypothetical protein